jgi:TRAP-type mannitol/chloroaromatic compound transport system substrate-binding protein
MDRRKFISASSAVAVTTVGGLVSAAAQEPKKPAVTKGLKEIKLVTTWPRGFAGLSFGAERVAKRITMLSGGRLNVKLFAAGEMVPAFEAFDAVASGQAEMYHGAEYYWDSKHKAFPFFTTVPLGMTAHELEAWMHFGGGQQLWDELSAQFGVKALLAGNTGVQMGGWYTEPIKSFDQLRSLKMRIPGLGGEVIKRFGGEALALPGGEILAAIKSGRINAAEWVGPWNDKEFGLHTVLNNYMFPGFHEPGTGLSLGINKKYWDGLGAEEQEIIRVSAHAENDIMMAEFNARNAAALAELVENHKVKLHTFPKDVWAQIAKVSQEVVLEIGQVDDLSNRLVQSWVAFQKRVSEWQQISDISYTAYRAITLKF